MEEIRDTKNSSNLGLKNDMQDPSLHGRKLPSGQTIEFLDHQKLFQITRTVDFDSCSASDSPVHIRSEFSTNNFTNFGKPSQGFLGMQRSSTIRYQVRGNLCQNFRIEGIDGESFLSYNPFGLRTEQLQTVTNSVSSNGF